jgi:hypothetical protein
MLSRINKAANAAVALVQQLFSLALAEGGL